MGKYYNGPTVDDIKKYDSDIEDWSKKIIVDMVSYYIRRTILGFRYIHSISIPIILFGDNIYTKDDLDWLTKELEEAGFKITIEKEEETNFDETYTISWGDK